MRRLTLILSDLYLPEESVNGDLPQSQPLPSLDWLLRYASTRAGIADWRRWLARELAAEALAERPPAQVRALAAGIDPGGVWLATPVRLEARLDHVRLADRGVLRLPPDQQQALAREFRATFAPEALVAGDDGGAFLLRGGPEVEARTADPTRLLDADVGPALPTGPGAIELRRLGAEIEMWLPGTRVNAERVRAGLHPISALWLWGGGPADARPLSVSVDESVRLYGSDAFLGALATLAATQTLRAAPRGFGELTNGVHAVVELAPMSGPADESLATLERHWFAPVRGALMSGRLDAVQLVANDCVFTTRPRAHWKFWRRRRGWLQSLA